MTVPAHNDNSNHDISATTIAIIGAFTHCHSALRRTSPEDGTTSKHDARGPMSSKPDQRPQNTNGKSRRQKGNPASAFGSLAASLKFAPVEIANVYSRGLRECGRLFVQGDNVARSALAMTLAKLNAGIVGALAAPLHASHSGDLHAERAKGVKSKKSARDSKATPKSASDSSAPAMLSNMEAVTLMLLSDTCRVEVVETLAALRFRMAVKLAPILLPFAPPTRCAACGITGHETRACPGSLPQPKQSRPRKAKQAVSMGKKDGSLRGRGTTVALVNHESGRDEKHWAIVRTIPRNVSKQRPQHKRNNSSTSSNITGTDLSDASTLALSKSSLPFAPSSPNPLYGSDAYAASNASKAGIGNSSLQTKHPVAGGCISRPPPSAIYNQSQIPARHPGPALPAKVPISTPSHAQHTCTTSPLSEPQHLRPIPRASLHSTARRSRPAESFYSFHSASTKIGEIPVDKWPTEWWDWDEAEHLNKAAKGAGVLHSSLETGQGARCSKRNAGMLRRIFARGGLGKR